LGVLLEPTAVVVKAWEHLEAVGRRARFEPRRVLVTGAGPIGMLAALLGRQRGLEVHVLDRVLSGAKPEIVRALGATYHTSLAGLDLEPEVVVECTGVGQSSPKRSRRSPAAACCAWSASATAARLAFRAETSRPRWCCATRR
jgi:threonine dehydrogenase-like Zn-dependent dehydrogenase